MLPDFRFLSVTKSQKEWVSQTLENIYNCELSSLTDRYTSCAAGIHFVSF